MASRVSPIDSSAFVREAFENNKKLTDKALPYLPIDAWVEAMKHQTISPHVIPLTRLEIIYNSFSRAMHCLPIRRAWLQPVQPRVINSSLGEPDRIRHLIFEREALYRLKPQRREFPTEEASIEQAKLAQEFIKGIFGMVRNIKTGKAEGPRYQNEYEQWLLDPTQTLSPDIIESRGNSALIEASRLGYDLIVKRLLESGVSVDKADREGKTPLMLAAEKGDTRMINLLLAKGALIDKGDNGGITPLILAAEKGHIAVIKLLLANGASIDRADCWRITPLMEATQHIHMGVAECLLENGASVEMADSMGKTPLMLAAEKGQIAVVKLLVAKGASIDRTDNQGRTALMLAAKKGHEDIAELLRSLAMSIYP
ncbi:MAG: ankyrin repeat domain-containing protein [Simkaniaceae bacterium]|nr:ankyrin repeat domain-containing protein [Simkaniaceae bacterium]